VGFVDVDCFRCGHYKLSFIAQTSITPAQFSRIEAANISGYIRENQRLEIRQRDLPDLRTIPTPTVAQKAMKGLIALCRKHPEPGSTLFLSFDTLESRVLNLKATAIDGGDVAAFCDDQLRDLLFLQGACWAQSSTELTYLMDQHLKSEGYIVDDHLGMIQVSPRGWAAADEARRGTIQSDTVFVAMPFRPIFDALYDKGLWPGIRNAGYEPVRIDRVPHNNRIDDEIIARIRSCRFLVADFSLNRGGIYFEAGFALGLGRPVLWTAREDRLRRVHFDTRQYNFVWWRPDEFGELAKRIQNRIEATIGRGPLPPVPQRSS
jgi:hypothetical protein